LLKDFLGTIEKDASLKELTTWKIGGKARYLTFPTDNRDMEILADFVAREGLDYFIMGRGSNILVSDDYYDGIVINTTKGFKERTVTGFYGRDVQLYLGAGNLSSEIMGFCIREGIGGLEFIAGIPASLGGLLKMNAGAFGFEILNFISFINVYSLSKGFYTVDKDKLRYGYRYLVLENDSIIVGAGFKLVREDEQVIKKKVADFISRRRASQPMDLPSCGSVFKNPEGDYAGRIIEELGLKGYQIGGARISEKHANFIVNTGDATAKDVLTLIELIKQKVFLKKGIVLKEEVIYFNINNKVKATVI